MPICNENDLFVNSARFFLVQQTPEQCPTGSKYGIRIQSTLIHQPSTPHSYRLFNGCIAKLRSLVISNSILTCQWQRQTQAKLFTWAESGLVRRDICHDEKLGTISEALNVGRGGPFAFSVSPNLACPIFLLRADIMATRVPRYFGSSWCSPIPACRAREDDYFLKPRWLSKDAYDRQLVKVHRRSRPAEVSPNIWSFRTENSHHEAPTGSRGFMTTKCTVMALLDGK